MRFTLIFLLFLISCTDQKVVEQSSGDLNSKNEFSCDLSNVPNSLRTPLSIRDSVDLINAIPKPVQLPCFIQALNRPIKMSSTLSRLSAQPAVGNDSPRVFFFIADLVIAISVEGVGSDLLELSEMYSPSKSLKGEIKFPVREEITYKEPFDRIRIEGGGTTCGSCHNDEEKDLSIGETEAFSSVAIKPVGKMHLGTFQNENYLCELVKNPDYRCQMIMSIFNFGEVLDSDFPNETPTFLETL